ncbi:MAG: hypothetical protein KGH75_04295 [Rhodospirillales bacterium]|nr:hypothetical protein [Rhodospirillales bacterium]
MFCFGIIGYGRLVWFNLVALASDCNLTLADAPVLVNYGAAHYLEDDFQDDDDGF